jgi:VWFA-related protein
MSWNVKNGLRFPAGALVAVLVISIGSGAQQENPGGNESDQLVFNTFVYDGHVSPAIGLSEQDFFVLIDKKPAKFDYFSSRDVPESIIVLVQTSGSMSHRDFSEAAVNRLGRLVVLSNRGSEFLIITFGDVATIVADWTSDWKALAAAVTGLEHGLRKGSSSLTDACMLALKKADQARNRKKFILLIADGADNKSKTSPNEMRRLLEDSRIPVNCIALTDPIYDPFAGPEHEFLVQIVRQTGGLISFPASRNEASDDIERLALLMRHAYQIGLDKASLPRDGRRHNLTVKVSPVSSKIREGEHFFAHAPESFRASN